MTSFLTPDILSLYNQPNHYGILKKYNHSAELSNVLCGDNLKIYLETEGTVIKDVSFTGEGCALTIAGASILLDRLIHSDYTKTLPSEDKWLKLFVPEIPPARQKCVLLSLKTFKKALGQK